MKYSDYVSLNTIVFNHKLWVIIEVKYYDMISTSRDPFMLFPLLLIFNILTPVQMRLCILWKNDCVVDFHNRRISYYVIRVLLHEIIA